VPQKGYVKPVYRKIGSAGLPASDISVDVVYKEIKRVVGSKKNTGIEG
jgi:hypothetical protein